MDGQEVRPRAQEEPEQRKEGDGDREHLLQPAFKIFFFLNMSAKRTSIAPTLASVASLESWDNELSRTRFRLVPYKCECPT